MKADDSVEKDENTDKTSNDSSQTKTAEGQNGLASNQLEEKNSDSDLTIEGQSDAFKQEEVKVLKRQVESFRKESETNFQKLQYLMADYDNYRKQMQRLTEERIEDARVNTLSRLIEIEDDFLEAIDLLKDSDCSTAIIEGFNGILKNFESLLKSEGVQEIESLGKPFNPDVHDPVSFMENNDQPEKTILQVKRKGYMLNNKLLRPSLVVLSKKTTTVPFQATQNHSSNIKHD